MAVKGQQVLQATDLPILDSTNQKIALPIPIRGVQTMAKGQRNASIEQIRKTTRYKEHVLMFLSI